VTADARRGTTGSQASSLDRWVLALACSSLVMAVDQVTKQIAVSVVKQGHPVDVIFGFELTNVRNRGVAFGLFGGGGDAVVVITLATMALLLAYFALNAARPGLWLVVGLVIGGALGNLADRVRINAAIDFLDPPLWPAFNLADVAIVAGVALLAASLVAQDRQHREG
jgi:signal peptidase II